MSEEIIMTEEQVVNQAPVPQKKKRSLIRLITDITLFVLVLALAFVTFVSFARPVTRIGNMVNNGENMSIISYLIGKDNSVLSQITSIVEIMNGESIEGASILAMVSKLMRIYIMVIMILVYVIVTLVNVIKAIVGFCKKKPLTLANSAVSSLCFSYLMAISLRFFGSAGGGEGDTAYFMGYTEGVGLRVMLIFSAVVLLGLAVVNFIFNKGKEREQTDNFWRRAIISAGIYSIMAGALLSVGGAGVFNQIISMPTNFIAAIAGGGFSLGAILSPVINLWIFVAISLILGRIRSGAKGAFRYLLCFGEEVNPKVYKPSKATKGFICPLVVCFIVLLSVILIKLPFIASGWQGDVFNQFIILFALASVGATLHSVFKDKKVIEEKKEVEEQTIESAEEITVEEQPAIEQTEEE
ncbi:MAG: hypothetical protein IJC07_04690 [Clostridia bacterium]|nr:hypothetical protein [Clostridia bacterium]